MGPLWGRAMWRFLGLPRVGLVWRLPRQRLVGGCCGLSLDVEYKSLGRVCVVCCGGF